MSIRDVPGRPGWKDVRVYDRVRAPGERPKPIDRRVYGQRAAQKLERELLAARDRGSLADQNITLANYATAYLRSRQAEVSRQTLRGYQEQVDRYIGRHRIGRAKVGAITVSMVADFYADLLNGTGRDSKGQGGEVVSAGPISPQSVRGCHRVLSMVLKRAVVDGLLGANPCSVAKPPKDVRDEVGEDIGRGLDPEDARRLLSALVDTDVYTAATLALGTGLRRSELLALRWSEVDLEEKELRVTGKLEQVGGVTERTATKTKRSRRTVPFSERTLGVLRDQRRRIAECRLSVAKDGLWSDEDWVFPSLRVSVARDGELLPAGRCWTPSAFAQAWRRGMAEANGRLLGEWVADGGEVRDFELLTVGIHALRHTYATMQLRAGVRDEIVSRRLGHSSSLITRRVYSHATQEEKREGVDVTDALLNGSE